MKHGELEQEKAALEFEAENDRIRNSESTE